MAKKSTVTPMQLDGVYPGYKTFKAYTDEAYKTLLSGTKASNDLPKKLKYKYFLTFPDFRTIMKQESQQLQTMISNIYQRKKVRGFTEKDMGERIKMLTTFNDALFMEVGRKLDELQGVSIVPEPVLVRAENPMPVISGSWNKRPTGVKPGIRPDALKALLAKNVIRPQLAFTDKIDNRVSTPWEPRIKDKPNSLKPLAIFLEETDDEFGQGFSHPYEFELDRFQPNDNQLTRVKPIVPKSLDDVPLKMVATKEELHDLYTDLLKYSEIAIDLEHHSYRSFMGITCLMQISTGDTDYLVDTLVLRNDLHILNEIFTKPSVVKVFHGAMHDIQWLQRDLSLYIVNLFDTYFAAKALEYPKLSLAALMIRFCKRNPDKTFQLADWRIRPLPEELKLYAREDTHYLLYIYHMLRNQLLIKGGGNIHILKSVLQQGTNLCKTRYVKPVFNDESYLHTYRMSRKHFNNRQVYALKNVYRWREMLAREEDESLGYVLPNHMLLNIAEALPREVQGILACCNPVPPLVRVHLLDIHHIILKARSQSVAQPILVEEAPVRQSEQFQNTINFEGLLDCPHDLSKTEEFRDDLPTLITDSNTKKIPPAISLKKPTVSVFEVVQNEQKLHNLEIEKQMEAVQFLSPFDRYKLVKAYIQNEDKVMKEKMQQIEQNKQQAQINTDRENTERVAKLYQKVHEAVHWLREQPEKIADAVQTVQTPAVPEPAATLPTAAQEDLTLRQMARKKRKREESPEAAPPPDLIPSQIQPDDKIMFSSAASDNTVKRFKCNTPLPDIHKQGTPNQAKQTGKSKKWRNKKRNQKNKHFAANQIPANAPNCSSQQQTVGGQQQPGMVHANIPPSSVKNPVQQVPAANGKPGEHKQITPKKYQSHPPNYSQQAHPLVMPHTNVTPNIGSPSEPQKQVNQSTGSAQNTPTSNQKRKNKKKNKNAKNKTDNFQAFDYANVNFNRFQGGSKTGPKPTEFKSKFKGKGKANKFTGKSNNKNSNFQKNLENLGGFGQKRK